MRYGQLTCEEVEAHALDTRYLAGTLPDKDAEAFEAHYFGCERCWNNVQRGIEVRAAEAGGPSPAGSARRLSRLTSRWSLAAAAALLLVAGGAWWMVTQDAGYEDTFRAAAADAAVIVGGSGDSLTASWRSRTEAEAHRVRVFASDGTLLLESETTDTSFAADARALRSAATGDTVYLEVRWLGPLQVEVARSPLTPAVLAPAQ